MTTTFVRPVTAVYSSSGDKPPYDADLPWPEMPNFSNAPHWTLEVPRAFVVNTDGFTEEYVPTAILPQEVEPVQSLTLDDRIEEGPREYEEGPQVVLEEEVRAERRQRPQARTYRRRRAGALVLAAAAAAVAPYLVLSRSGSAVAHQQVVAAALPVEIIKDSSTLDLEAMLPEQAAVTVSGSKSLTDILGEVTKENAERREAEKIAAEQRAAVAARQTTTTVGVVAISRSKSATTAKTITSVDDQETESGGELSVAEIKKIIVQAALRHGVDPQFLLDLADCESDFDLYIKNYDYIQRGNEGYPTGLFQHVEGYWDARAAEYGYPGASIHDAKAQANVTAQMVKVNRGAWEC